MKRFLLIVVGFFRRLYPSQPVAIAPPVSRYGAAFTAFAGVMYGSTDYDGRRLRQRLIDVFWALGIDDAAIETINPAATMLRIVRRADPSDVLLLWRDGYGWNARRDDFADVCVLPTITGADDVADEIAAFLVAA
jgi:hypothetical protein